MIVVYIKSLPTLTGNSIRSRQRRKAFISFKIKGKDQYQPPPPHLKHEYKLPHTEHDYIWSDPYSHKIIYYQRHDYMRAFYSPRGYKASAKLSPHRHQKM